MSDNQQQQQTSTSPTPTPTPTATSAIKGRPRSSSISSGSPGPPPGSSLPQPIQTTGWSFRSAPAQSALTSSLSNPSNQAHGWAHRPTLSVPGIVAPLPLAPGGPNRMRHRRTQSVSPPGFPIISQDNPTGFAPSGSSGPPLASGIPPGGIRHSVDSAGTQPQPPKLTGIPIGPVKTNGSNSLFGKSPTTLTSTHSSPSSSVVNQSIASFSTSPTGHSHHPSSHAALLSGVRSHALPHSPVFAGVADSVGELGDVGASRTRRGSFGRHQSPALSSSPQSPPFGPTSPSNHHPSPLGLEYHRSSPDLAFDAIINRRRSSVDDMHPLQQSPDSGSHSFVDHSHFGSLPIQIPIPVASGRALSPPLLPLSLTPPEGGPLSPPTGLRPRSTSIDRASASPVSPASLFADEKVPTAVSPRSPNDDGSALITSPPLSPPLCPPSLLPPPLSPSSKLGNGSTSPYSSSSGFSPNGASRVLPRPCSPPPRSPLFDLAPLPTAANSESIDPTEHTTDNQDEANPVQDDTFMPPPSPHRGTIALPPPVVAPAPLPHHLGGPSLHGEKQAKGRPSRAHKALVASTLASGSHITGTEHAPKRHSPLASPALSSDDDDQDDESPLGREGNHTEMSVDDQPRPSQAQDQDQNSTDQDQHSLRDETSPEPTPEELDEGFGSSSPPQQSPEIRAAISQGPDGEMMAYFDQPTCQEPEFDVVAHQSAEPSSFGALGFMDVDPAQASALGLETGVAPAEIEGHQQQPDTSAEVIAIDEDNLSALERIFVCAKSDSSLERAKVGHHLADWLKAVDMAESVEYVLPLLAGLGTDSEEIVKEVFAPQLDRIMWHFFSQCPLTELDPHHDDHSAQSESGSPTGSPVPSRYHAPRLISSDSAQPSPTFTQFDEGSLDHAPPSTAKTSATNSEVSDAPHLSASSFTSLLGALLTDQSALVAKSTEAALVRFLCQLKGKPIPDPNTAPSEMTDDLLRELGPSDVDVLVALAGPRKETGYKLTPEASHVLEDEFVSGIVLGLARLDEDGDHDKTNDHSGPESSIELSRVTSRAPVEVPEEATVTLVLSPEEEQIEDGWLSHDPARSSGMDGWGSDPVISFEDSSVDDGQDMGFGEPVSVVPSPRPAEQSAFSPDAGNGDDESSIGKMVSMSLIGAIAEANCLDYSVLVQQILPEVDRMKSESAFFVRKEAVQALASLAKCVPLDVLENKVIPLHAEFAQDSLWHVRRAACLALPDVTRRLPEESLRKAIVSNVDLFSTDSSRNVRSGALEVCGELIYLFHEKPLGVPRELIGFFLGENGPRQAEVESVPADDVFAPLQSALDSPPSSFYDNVPGWGPNGPTSKDPDRPVMCAFNIPACCLTLGRDQWPVLRHYYLSLCRERADKVRQSLASSLHEIARIIGPAQADESLVEPFTNFLVDLDHIQGAALENVETTLSCFGPKAGKRALEALSEAWPQIKLWRKRQSLAKSIINFADHFTNTGGTEQILRLLSQACKDSVAAVRNQAALVLPAVLSATDPETDGRRQVLAFLDTFAHDSAYRARLTFTASVEAIVEGGFPSVEAFEDHFLHTLARLADDKVVSVRIGVARVIGAACRSEALYADEAERSERLKELLVTLAGSEDRDVRAPVHDFVPKVTVAEPEENEARGRERSREGATSRLGLRSDEEDDPMEAKSPAEDHLMAEAVTPRAASPSATLPPPYAASSTDTIIASTPAAEDSSEDVDMPDSDEPVLLERPGSGALAGEGEGEGDGEAEAEGEEGGRRDGERQLWTSELEGFVSVSRTSPDSSP